MSEPAIKKYAEAAAFVRLAGTILQRTGQPLTEQAPDVSSALQSIAATELPAVSASHSDLFEAKRAKTSDKLTTMMELYIGDEWDNPIEVLEWSSFFAGAGAAHCAIAGRLYSESADETDTSIPDTLARLEPLFRDALDTVIKRLGQ